MGEPVCIVDGNQPEIYHPINWQRLGSYCGLPLNQDKIYLDDMPDDLTCCEACLNAMPHVRKLVKRYKKIESTDDTGKDSRSDGEVPTTT